MTDLNATIDEAFADVEYPGDGQLTAYGSEGREFDATWNLLHGKHWRDMPVFEFITGDTPIPDLTAQALHYYLPALLKASFDVKLSLYVLGSLTYYLNPINYRPRSYWLPKYNQFRSQLTKRQIDAIAATIEEWNRRDWLGDVVYWELKNAYNDDRTPLQSQHGTW